MFPLVWLASAKSQGHLGHPNLLFKMLTFAIILFSRLFTLAALPSNV